MNYGVDKKHHKKTRTSGEQIEYLVTPYRMAAKEGKYYLICNFNKLQGSDGRKLNINGLYHDEYVQTYNRVKKVLNGRSLLEPNSPCETYLREMDNERKKEWLDEFKGVEI